MVLRIVVVCPPGCAIENEVAVVVIRVVDAVHAGQLVLVIDCEGRGRRVVGPLAQIPRWVVR